MHQRTVLPLPNREYPDRFFVQDLSTDQLPPELQKLKFDTIISTEVIEHLYNPEGFIDFCKKHLAKKWRDHHFYTLSRLLEKPVDWPFLINGIPTTAPLARGAY